MENKLKDQNRDVIYQVSLLQSLAYGDYCGSVTVKELKQHGDVGIGTFNKLNGELIMLDGDAYRAAGDGSVEIVSDDETIPFSIVTYMDSDDTKQLGDIPDFDALCNTLNQIVELSWMPVLFFFILFTLLLWSCSSLNVDAHKQPGDLCIDCGIQHTIGIPEQEVTAVNLPPTGVIAMLL